MTRWRIMCARIFISRTRWCSPQLRRFTTATVINCSDCYCAAVWWPSGPVAAELVQGRGGEMWGTCQPRTHSGPSAEHLCCSLPPGAGENMQLVVRRVQSISVRLMDNNPADRATSQQTCSREGLGKGVLFSGTTTDRLSWLQGHHSDLEIRNATQSVLICGWSFAFPIRPWYRYGQFSRYKLNLHKSEIFPMNNPTIKLELTSLLSQTVRG